MTVLNTVYWSCGSTKVMMTREIPFMTSALQGEGVMEKQTKVLICCVNGDFDITISRNPGSF